MRENSVAGERLGRILALDLGEKRIGVAVSDPTLTLASSLTVLARSSRAADFAAIRRLVDEQKATKVVIGLPILLSGQEGSKAAWARDYAADLGEHLPVPVVLWDESLSTADALASQRARGRRGRRQRKDVDAIAAAFILQSYLDAQRETAQTSNDSTTD